MKLRTDIPPPDGKHVNLECYNCKNVFSKTMAEYRRALNGKRACMFCSYACSVEYRRNNLKRFKAPCNNCGKEVERGEHERNENNKYYCNHSCAATQCNIVNPKRQKTANPITIDGVTIFQGSRYIRVEKRECACGKQVANSIDLECAPCARLTLTKSRTLKFCKKLKEDDQSKNIFDPIRLAARRYMQDQNIAKACVYCGYDKFVEACHIKPIASFHEDTTWAEINSLSNLVYLCPNHHKELDVLKEPELVEFIQEYSKKNSAL